MVIHYLQCGVQPAILPCLHAMYPDKFKVNTFNSLRQLKTQFEFEQHILPNGYYHFRDRRSMTSTQSIWMKRLTRINRIIIKRWENCSTAFWSIIAVLSKESPTEKTKQKLFKTKNSSVCFFPISVLKSMQFRYERPAFCQLMNAERMFPIKMIQMNGNNFALKVNWVRLFSIIIIIGFADPMLPSYIPEPFDRSNTARSCCDEKIFERIRKVFYESWLLLGKTKDLETLFGEPLAPPAFNAIYDNYMQAPSHQTHGIHMEYMMR